MKVSISPRAGMLEGQCLYLLKLVPRIVIQTCCSFSSFMLVRVSIYRNNVKGLVGWVTISHHYNFLLLHIHIKKKLIYSADETYERSCFPLASPNLGIIYILNFCYCMDQELLFQHFEFLRLLVRLNIFPMFIITAKSVLILCSFLL